MNTEKATEQSRLQKHIIGYLKIIDLDTGCWFKSLKANKQHYQTIKYDGKYRGVHIVSAIAFLNHHLDSNLIVCHRCDRPACFNPKHLFLGTTLDNIHDAIKKGRNRFHRDAISRIETINYLKPGSLRDAIRNRE